VKPSAETDFHLEAPPVRGAERLRSTEDRCPACGALLDVFALPSVEFEACPRCKGLWLDKVELRKLKDNLGDGGLYWLNREIEEIEKAAMMPCIRPCAKCPDTIMISVVFGASSAIVDWCRKCHGLWLDHREFEAILQYLRDEAGKVTSKELKHEVAADLKETVQGGSGSRLEKLADTEAALHALVFTTIFEHPKLFTFCTASKGI
jgi:Zn-finger nucleic acid-binding protein